MGLIYKATNLINGKSYIGQTRQSLTKRQNSHFHNAFTKNQPFVFYQALRKYGKENFTWTIIEDNIKDLAQLNEREKYWIAYYNTFQNGYNMTSGGDEVDNLNKWRADNPDLMHFYAKQGYLKMKEKMEQSPELNKKRQEKATAGMKRYVENHREEWSQKSYETYLKHKEQVDAQFREFHKQQSKAVKCIETGIEYPSASEAARQTGLSQGNISSVCRGERQSTGKGPNGEKLHWIYL